MTGRIDADEIRASLLERIEELCRALLPNGHRDKSEWKAGDASGAAGDSLGVALAGEKVGLWHDRSTREGGTVFDLIAVSQSISEFRDVLEWAANWLGEAPKEPAGRPRNRAPSKPRPAVLAPITPIPETAGRAPEHPKHGAPSSRWLYRDAAGGALMLVNRFDKPDGSKVVLPQIFGVGPSGLNEWMWLALPAPRPMYALDRLAARPDDPVLVNEGEKSADAAQALLPSYVSTTWPNGCGGTGHFDPSPLAGRAVIIWPDADDAGRDAAAAVAQRAVEAGAASVRVVELPDGLPKGWDLANPLPDGMGIDDAVRLIDTAPVWQPDPPPAGPEPEPVADDNGHEGNPGDTAEQLEAEAARLASMSLAQRALERKDIAKRFGVTVAVLDVLIKGFLAHEGSGQGDEMTFDEIEPWGTEVDGAALLDEVVRNIRAYVVMPPAAADAVALWCAHTHALDAFFVSPRLMLKSAEKRSGKTTLLHVLRQIVPRPLPVSSISGAGIFRTVHAYQPTLLIDEADAFMRDNEEIRGIVNSSHTRGDFAVRMIGQGTDMKPARFATWCAMAISGIGRQADTIEDRSLIILLERKMPFDRVRKFRVDRMGELVPLARKLARWASDHVVELADADPAMPDGLHDRAADNWRCLISIADAAGDDWPERARAAAQLLSGGAATEDDSIRVKLLHDIHEIFDEAGDAAMSSTDLVWKLNEMEGRPWPEYRRGKPLSTNQLAGLLRPFGIAPKQIWADGSNIRGYDRAVFSDAFKRYLHAESPSGGSQGARPLGTAEIQGVQPDSRVLGDDNPSTLESSCDLQKTGDPSTLAPWNTPDGREHAKSPSGGITTVTPEIPIYDGKDDKPYRPTGPRLSIPIKGSQP